MSKSPSTLERQTAAFTAMRGAAILRKKVIHAAMVLMVTGGAVPAAVAQQNDQETLQLMRRDLDELIKGQIELQKQMTEMKALLQSQGGQPAPQVQAMRTNFVMNLDGIPCVGDTNAAVTMIEFSDYQCPYCAKYATDTFPQIEKDYIKSGKVRYVIWDFPLAMHPLAQKAAEAAHCANEQGGLSKIRGVLFGHQEGLTTNRLTDLAQQASLDTNQFSQCFWTGKESGSVTQEVAQASSEGVTGTPTFFIGLTGTNGSNVKIANIIVGAQPYTTFQAALDGLVAAGKGNL